MLEELQTQNLVKRPKPKQAEETGQYLPNGASAKAGLNKSISDAGWGMFTDMLQVKAACAGRVIAFVDPKYTSQVCSNCGVVRKKTLEERWHSCECGCELERDTNAAKNILKKHIGAGSVPQTPRVGSLSKPLSARHGVLHLLVMRDDNMLHSINRECSMFVSYILKLSRL